MRKSMSAAGAATAAAIALAGLITAAGPAAAAAPGPAAEKACAPAVVKLADIAAGPMRRRERRDGQGLRGERPDRLPEPRPAGCTGRRTARRTRYRCPRVSSPARSRP